MTAPATTPTRVFEVGGCVRDSFLGLHSKDIDLAVEVESFTGLHAWLQEQRFDVFDVQPDYLTIRARFPKQPDPALANLLPRLADMRTMTVDFVMCRADGDYTDGRRPDTVTAGTIYDDLARRDYTVNAIARGVDGAVIDPHGGLDDLKARVLRAVGDPEARLREDALRALRAVRFAITKGLTLDEDLRAALRSGWMPALLRDNAHFDRRRGELHKALRHNTPATLSLLADLGPAFLEAALGEELWLKPTNEH